MSGAKAFGEQNPTLGETPVSWQTWSDGSGTVPTISGDADWGKLQLDLDTNDEGRSAVYDLGSTIVRTYRMEKNRYGSGTADAALEIRGDTNTFNQDDVTPTWQLYTVDPIVQTWRFVQVRARTAVSYKTTSPVWSGATYPTGTAIVSFRHDGGYSQDITVQGHHEARGWKAGFALTRSLIDGGPTRLTLAQCYAIRDAGHEIMAHGGSVDPTTGNGWDDYVLQVGTYTEELRLLGFPVDMHIQSGVFTGEYLLDNINQMGSREDLLVRQHFHCAEAYIYPFDDIPNTCNNLPFPEVGRWYKKHTTLDQSNAATAISKIDGAIAGGHGIEFLLHTHYLDDVGYITTVDWLAILDYVAGKVTSNDCVVLTPTQQLFAAPV